MNKPSREALDLYYREADSWSGDRERALAGSRRTAWIVATVAVVVAVAEALALMGLAPLKSVEPYTLLVDRQTGFVEALKPVDAQKIAPDAALTRSFLVQYVIAREGFDATTVQTDYRKVALWSADPARRDYINAMQAGNPASPLTSLPRSTLLSVRVKSVSPIGGKSAAVRFETQRQDARAQPLPPRAWVAIITYRFSDAAMSVDDRFVNPLGFQVVRYRRDEEALPLPTAAAPGAAPGGAVPVPSQGGTTQSGLRGAPAGPTTAPTPAQPGPGKLGSAVELTL